ncbi:MAG: hypothetical protein J5687_03295, partial [Treponema sp.]|nr:hypothetical protein [Treponema sp.]
MNFFTKVVSKKISKGFAFAAGLLMLMTFCFTSCENFLQAEDVKQEIVNTIEYNNAPSYVIKVEVDNDSGSLKEPVVGQVTKKVTDVFTVKFAPKNNYQFIKWEAVFTNDRMQNEDIRNYIEFEDETSLETKVTFKKASDSIEIRAVCPEKFTVELETPDPKNASNPKDTSIVLKFNHPLSADCLTGQWPTLGADTTASESSQNSDEASQESDEETVYDDDEEEAPQELKWSQTEWAKKFIFSISGIDDEEVMSYFQKPELTVDDATQTSRLIFKPNLAVKNGKV